MLDFDFKKRHMKEEEDIALTESNKSYWNESHCYISKNRWDVKYLEKRGTHYLA